MFVTKSSAVSDSDCQHYNSLKFMHVLPLISNGAEHKDNWKCMIKQFITLIKDNLNEGT
jgi:hypothetical protein